MNGNTPETIDAILKPSPLTLGKVALLEKIDSPLLRSDITSMAENLKAIYCVKKPTAEVVKDLSRLTEVSLAYGDEIGFEGYKKELAEVIDSLAAFYEMLPRPDSEKKTP